MKILALASILALCAGPQVSSTPAPAPRIELAGHGVDDPPPVECPMCGGNVELHRKRTKMLANLRTTLLLMSAITH